MTLIVLLNGAPAAGKSTLAELLAQDRVLALPLDLDVIKHSLGQWDANAAAAGRQARRLGLAMAREHVSRGHDVFVGQYLARIEFIEALESLARETGSDFVEIVLAVDAPTLVARLEGRARHPHRTEHLVNAALTGVDDVEGHLRALEQVIAQRPAAIVVDASSGLEATADRIRAHLPGGLHPGPTPT